MLELGLEFQQNTKTHLLDCFSCRIVTCSCHDYHERSGVNLLSFTEAVSWQYYESENSGKVNLHVCA